MKQWEWWVFQEPSLSILNIRGPNTAVQLNSQDAPQFRDALYSAWLARFEKNLTSDMITLLTKNFLGIFLHYRDISAFSTCDFVRETYFSRVDFPS
jgi:hypothetical protein